MAVGLLWFGGSIHMEPAQWLWLWHYKLNVALKIKSVRDFQSPVGGLQPGVKQLGWEPVPPSLRPWFFARHVGPRESIIYLIWIEWSFGIIPQVWVKLIGIVGMTLQNWVGLTLQQWLILQRRRGHYPPLASVEKYIDVDESCSWIKCSLGRM